VEHPVALQLGGNDPGELAAAARIGAAAGYDEINLNVGCPSDRVQAGCFGAALMLEPRTVADCVAAMRAAVSIPVTVKTRLGVDEHDSYEFVRDFIATVAAAGCETFIVHARKAWLSGLSPKQNREIPPLDYPRVYRLKNEFPELCIVINGGLTTVPASAEQLLHVDGVMLGRVAYQDSWLVGELDARLFDGTAADEREVWDGFLSYVARELDRGTPLRMMTRHLLGMRTGRAGGRRWRRGLGELAADRAGLDDLRALIAACSEGVALAAAAPNRGAAAVGG
jgi:tRNA-dihydrouridine synthase A